MLPIERGKFGIFPADLCRGLPAIEQVIITWLCYHSDKNGICWPSYTTLSKEIGISRCTIIKKIKLLEQKGVLLKTHSHPNNKAFSSNSYKIIIKNIQLNKELITKYEQSKLKE